MLFAARAAGAVAPGSAGDVRSLLPPQPATSNSIATAATTGAQADPNRDDERAAVWGITDNSVQHAGAGRSGSVGADGATRNLFG